MKRTIDVFGSIVGIILFSPVIIIFAILVLISERVFPFYTQQRVGKGGRIFRIYKIRSMVRDADKISNWTLENDPRITKIGKFMREWNIDELPQFLNVLKGDMSLVGPRPETPENVEKFEREYPGYHKRKRIKPGMTGFSQAHGYRGDTCIHKRKIMDWYYVKHQSTKLDLYLILKTIKLID